MDARPLSPSSAQPDAPSTQKAIEPHQADPARRRRLRWRSRRGLLENDLLLTRFFDRYEQSLSDDDVVGLDNLLEAQDNDLLDLILARTELQGAADTPAAARVLALLRDV